MARHTAHSDSPQVFSSGCVLPCESEGKLSGSTHSREKAIFREATHLGWGGRGRKREAGGGGDDMKSRLTPGGGHRTCGDH